MSDDTVPSPDVKIEEVGSDDEMPNLEPVAETTEAGAEATGTTGKRSRLENKSRKQFAKLGLKQIPGVVKVVVRQRKQAVFVVNQPDVYKSPQGDSYVFFGEASADQDADAAAFQEQARQLAAQHAASEPAAAPAASAAAEEAVDEEGVNPKHIDLVLEQAPNATRAQAIQALKNTGGDIVAAIMEVTM